MHLQSCLRRVNGQLRFCLDEEHTHAQHKRVEYIPTSIPLVHPSNKMPLSALIAAGPGSGLMHHSNTDIITLESTQHGSLYTAG